MTARQLVMILAHCEFEHYAWLTGRMGTGFYLQVSYLEKDVYSGVMSRQRGRKWYVSSHAIRSEVVQTAFKAVMTSIEHRAREFFRYRGVNVFQPHYDVEELVRLRKSARGQPVGRPQRRARVRS